MYDLIRGGGKNFWYEREFPVVLILAPFNNFYFTTNGNNRTIIQQNTLREYNNKYVVEKTKKKLLSFL